MGILGDILGVNGIADAAKGITDKIGDVVLKYIPDADKKIQAQAEMQKVAAESEAALYNSMATVMSADSKSDSAFTRMIRPAAVSWALGSITAIGILGYFNEADPVIKALQGVPADFWQVLKYGIGIYVGGRSAEKISGTIGDVIKAVVRK